MAEGQEWKETFHHLLFDAFWILNHINKSLAPKEETDKIKTKKREEKLTYCDLYKVGFVFLL